MSSKVSELLRESRRLTRSSNREDISSVRRHRTRRLGEEQLDYKNLDAEFLDPGFRDVILFVNSMKMAQLISGPFTGTVNNLGHLAISNYEGKIYIPNPEKQSFERTRDGDDLVIKVKL